MGYRVVRADEHEWLERPPREGQVLPRYVSDLTSAASLKESRARLWRLPAHTRGLRHRERTQEEVFVVLSGTLTMLLGDPPDRFDLTPPSVVSAEPGTALQMRNESDEDVLVLAYGAPPVAGEAQYLDDVELS
jgi:mannose-6-phosphate isomerase-like protein (cupin superfamily)